MLAAREAQRRDSLSLSSLTDQQGRYHERGASPPSRPDHLHDAPAKSHRAAPVHEITEAGSAARAPMRPALSPAVVPSQSGSAPQDPSSERCVLQIRLLRWHWHAGGDQQSRLSPTRYVAALILQAHRKARANLVLQIKR